MDEKEILTAVSQGDVQAFEKLFLTYHPRLTHFLNGMIQNEDEACDFAQDIFLDIWEKREKLANVLSFSSYLFIIAKRAVCNYYDHLMVKSKYASEVSYSIDVSPESEEELLFAKELSARIDKVIEGLSPQRRKVYEMSRNEGLTNNEIAQRLGISKRTVENHLTAVLAILRKIICVHTILFLSKFYHF